MTEQTRKLHITYDAFDNDGVLLPEGITESHARNVVRKFYHDGETCDIHITYASSLPITVYRVLICEGILQPDDIEFIFENNILRADKDGRIAHWPTGFCEYEIDLLTRMISL